MKKVLTSFFLVLMVASLPIAAYAADDTTGGSMDVSYEYTAPGSGGEDGGDSDDGGTVDYDYLVTIPTNVTINAMEVVPITIFKNYVPYGKKIEVAVDWNKSYDTNGYFNLFKNRDSVDEEAIRCKVYVYTDSTLSTLQSLDNFQEPPKKDLVVDFMSGSLSPSYGGFLCFEPLTEDISVSSGTYTGTLHFNIEVLDI